MGCTLSAAEVVEASPTLSNPAILIKQSAEERALYGGPSWVYPNGHVVPIARIKQTSDGMVEFDLSSTTMGVAGTAIV